MKIITIQTEESERRFDGDRPIDISIPLKFNSSQPNVYGIEAASSTACEYGDLVGDTRRGGSCNFTQVTLIPHCNCTHTECVGHITNERISVRECLKDAFIPALVISVQPETQKDSEDRVISSDVLEKATSNNNIRVPPALIVRTLPNNDSKLTRQYGSEIPPYFSAEAMKYIVECGFTHLLVDLPSIDRLHDEGKLLNHRIFWNVGKDSFETNADTRRNSTITELIYVPTDVDDGEYLLNLQIAPFESDASPSRPLLFRLK